MKRKILILKIILYICGIFCIVYPLYSKFLSYREQTEAIYDYQKEVENMNEKELEEKRKKSEEFNKENSLETSVVDPNNINADENVASVYSFLEVGEIIGYINIPKISVELPIYEGVTSNNLSKGIAHMENTSLPNGDISTHSILAGHTGITNAVFFDNLNEIEIDDEFYITFYGKTSKYKVIEEAVVLPSETTGLKIEEGRCLVTLVTCTPKSVNTHRLLVTGEKVVEEEIITDEETEIVEQTVPTIVQQKSTFRLIIDFIKINKYLFILILILIIIFIILTIISIIKKRYRKMRK